MTQERLNPDQLAAGEESQLPTTASEAADLTDKYDRMLRLADLFDRSGDEMRTRARLGERDPARRGGRPTSAELSKATYAQAEDDIRAATTGKHGLLTRSRRARRRRAHGRARPC